jgi:hypothetical protein
VNLPIRQQYDVAPDGRFLTNVNTEDAVTSHHATSKLEAAGEISRTNGSAKIIDNMATKTQKSATAWRVFLQLT